MFVGTASSADPSYTDGSSRAFLGPASLEAAASGTLLSRWSPRLPRKPLLGFSQVDSMTLAGGQHGLGAACASVDLASLDWIFACHFQDDPILPGSVMLEALLQLLGLYAALAGLQGVGRAVQVDGVRFVREVTPQLGRIEYHVEIRRLHRPNGMVLASGKAFVCGEPCMSAERLVVCIMPIPLGAAPRT